METSGGSVQPVAHAPERPTGSHTEPPRLGGWLAEGYG